MVTHLAAAGLLKPTPMKYLALALIAAFVLYAIVALIKTPFEK